MCMQRTYLDEDTGDWWSDHELAVRAVSFLVSQRESRILLVVGTATARKLAGTQAETARQGVDRLLARGTSNGTATPSDRGPARPECRRPVRLVRSWFPVKGG